MTLASYFERLKLFSYMPYTDIPMPYKERKANILKQLISNTTMSNVTTNPKALIGGAIYSDNEILTIEDVQQFLKECASCIGEQFQQHALVSKLSFSYYLKDGLQMFNEEEVKHLDNMMFQCSELCEELHDFLPDRISDAIQEAKGLLTIDSVKNLILDIVSETIECSNVRSIETKAGGNWITMEDGVTYSVRVVKCD